MLKCTCAPPDCTGNSDSIYGNDIKLTEEFTQKWIKIIEIKYVADCTLGKGLNWHVGGLYLQESLRS